jgi:hypothetical protein
MSPYRDQIARGDGSLIKASVHSPDYTPGVSGWSINKDGSAEFSDLLGRGEIIVGPDDGFQVVIMTAGGAGEIDMYTHAATEGTPGKILGDVQNEGLANEWMGLRLRSPAHPVGGVADQYIQLSLNSQNADNTSRANAQFARIDPSVPSSTLIASFDENNTFLQSTLTTISGNLQLNGNVNGWGTWTPTWTGTGGAAFSTNTGYYKNFGDMYWFRFMTIPSVAGAGATVLTFTLPVNPDRTIRQTFDVHYETAAGNLLTGNAVAFTGGAGAVVDRVRVQDAGAVDRIVNMTGANLTVGSLLSVWGWFRA